MHEAVFKNFNDRNGYAGDLIAHTGQMRWLVVDYFALSW